MNDFDKGYNDAVQALLSAENLGTVMDEYLKLPESDYKRGWKHLLSNADGRLGVLILKISTEKVAQ